MIYSSFLSIPSLVFLSPTISSLFPYRRFPKCSYLYLVKEQSNVVRTFCHSSHLNILLSIPLALTRVTTILWWIVLWRIVLRRWRLIVLVVAPGCLLWSVVLVIVLIIILAVLIVGIITITSSALRTGRREESKSFSIKTECVIVGRSDGYYWQNEK